MKRPIRIVGDVAYIPLTQGLESVIDTEDVPLVEGYNWCARFSYNRFYASRSEKILGKNKWFHIHRVVFDTPMGFQTDHIDGDSLNNRKSNLRVVTCAQNQHNTSKRVNNKSGFKGVSWYSRDEKWQSHICLNNKRYQLGRFDTVEEAHAAYCEASKRLHGVCGKLDD